MLQHVQVTNIFGVIFTQSLCLRTEVNSGNTVPVRTATAHEISPCKSFYTSVNSHVS